MRTRVVAICLLAAAASVAADEIRLMSAGAVEPGLVLVVEQFRRSSGHTVHVEFGTGPQLTSRMAAGQTGDVLIAPRATMDDAAAKGKVEASTRKTVGRVGVGIVARTGGPAPDVSSVEGLKSSLLKADAVVFNRGSTGLYVEQLLEKLGVADQIAGKIVRLDNGDAVMRRLIAGKGNEFGFGAITEIRLFEAKGARLVAPLPAGVQNFTAYDVAVMTGARTPQAAAEFVRFITTDAARGVFAGAGVEASE
jgi:molybdate transport system substrate-binding protein